MVTTENKSTEGLLEVVWKTSLNSWSPGGEPSFFLSYLLVLIWQIMLSRLLWPGVHISHALEAREKKIPSHHTVKDWKHTLLSSHFKFPWEWKLGRHVTCTVINKWLLSDYPGLPHNPISLIISQILISYRTSAVKRQVSTVQRAQ